MNNPRDNYIMLPPMRLNEGVRIAYVNQMVNLFKPYLIEAQNYVRKLDNDGTLDETPMQVRIKLEKLKKEFQKALNTKGREYTLRMYLALLKSNDAAFRAAIKNIMINSSNPNLIGAIGILRDLNAGLGKRRKNLSSEEKKTINFEINTMMAYMSAILGEFVAKVTFFIGQSIFDKGDSNILKKVVDAASKAIKQAVMVSNDQLHKLNQHNVVQYMMEHNIYKFIWEHTNSSERFREYHKYVLDGETFDIRNPPVIDPKTGVRGFPGDLAFCKCAIVPII